VVWVKLGERFLHQKDACWWFLVAGTEPITMAYSVDSKKGDRFLHLNIGIG
jgi:hypothetical protein